MKALILNSGLGNRMGALTNERPKCMTEISKSDTILSRQLNSLVEKGIQEVIITTGYHDKILVQYCNDLKLPLKYIFVNNPIYDQTNYIYSIYCAKDYFAQDDILLMHGDLVYESSVIDDVLQFEKSCMVVSSTAPLPEKDFKAVVSEGRIIKVGIEFKDDAVCAQPLYKLLSKDWNIWLDAICRYCDNNKKNCYAEAALNEVALNCSIFMLDIKDRLCEEIDNTEDLYRVRQRLDDISERKVYMSFSTDIIHSGHISLIKKAARLGKVIIGVMTDEVVASYKRLPIVPCDERMALFSNIKDVYKVVEQKELSYKNILMDLKPDFVVHGDDWVCGVQKPVRDEVINILSIYGGQLIEYPYRKEKKYDELDRRARQQLSMPDYRRGSLRKLLKLKPIVSVIEAHSGITGLIAEKTVVYENNKAFQFDGMWVSSLCDSTIKGKPDIELVDMSSRLRTIDDIMDVTTKPIILDGDTGGLTEHFVYYVKTLERMGVSAIIIEDKIGLKKNSLFGTEVEQTQDSIENFCVKISAGKKAQKTSDFMIIARIESLILEKGMEDALERAFAYVVAGADGIMIHSRKKEPYEIFQFVERFREKDSLTPIIVVPTSFNSVKESEFADRGVNIVIYANQLTRSGIPAMQKTAELILKNHRAKEADDNCMSIKDILTLIPEE